MRPLSQYNLQLFSTKKLNQVKTKLQLIDILRLIFLNKYNSNNEILGFSLIQHKDFVDEICLRLDFGKFFLFQKSSSCMQKCVTFY